MSTPDIILGPTSGNIFLRPANGLTSTTVRAFELSLIRNVARTALTHQSRTFFDDNSASYRSTVEVTLVTGTDDWADFIQDVSSFVDTIGEARINLYLIADSDRIITTSAAETAGNSVPVSYDGAGVDFFKAGDFLFYGDSTPTNEEVIIVQSHTPGSSLFVAESLANNHAISQTLFRAGTAFSNCVLIRTAPPVAATGKGAYSLTFESEKRWRTNTELP